MLKIFKLLVREILTMPVRIRRNRYFKLFVREHLNLCEYNSKLMEAFNVLVFGSDQIWNPIICRGFDSVYLGNVNKSDSCRLISYAASVGSVQYLDMVNNVTLCSSLSKFYKLSCREEELSDFLSKKLSLTISTVLDPVLLAGKDIILKLTNKLMCSKPFVLLFTITQFPLAKNIAYDIAKTHNLHIIEIVSDQIALSSSRIKHAVSIPDFLGYIEGASIVITASFHGTALSLLYEKEFYYVADDLKLAKRVDNLLSPLALQKRIVSSSEQCNAPQIKYNEVNSQIAVTQMSFDTCGDNNLKDEILNLDLLNMTPLDAINALYSLQKKAKNN